MPRAALWQVGPRDYHANASVRVQIADEELLVFARHMLARVDREHPVRSRQRQRQRKLGVAYESVRRGLNVASPIICCISMLRIQRMQCPAILSKASAEIKETAPDSIVV